MSVHRRKSSREDKSDNVEVSAANGHALPVIRSPATSDPDPPKLNGYSTSVPQQRQRVLSSPTYPQPPTMYSPVPGSPSLSPGPSATGFPRQHRGHARSPSAAAFYPPSPSPLSASFPAPTREPPPPPTPNQSGTEERRRHARIHSRNLSVFFPRPGTLPQATIAEDGSQELEVDLRAKEEAPVTLMPLQQGRELQQTSFKFGGRKEGSTSPLPDKEPKSAASRRGHHHKHSVSHNFFSFMEPQSASHLSPSSASFPASSSQSSSPLPSSPHPQALSPLKPPTTTFAIFTSPIAAGALGQFILGSTLWVRGQQVGSLTTTGLGYWIVFDAIGIVLAQVLPEYLSMSAARSPSRMYGNARVGTVLAFAQSIYLIFASVYICKEAVEHGLLSHGQGEVGHHHHAGDESAEAAFDFPNGLFLIALASLMSTSIFADNNNILVSATPSHLLPSLPSLIQSLPFRRPPPALPKFLSNPFTTIPFIFILTLFLAQLALDKAHWASADMVIAALLAFATFSVAYPVARSLGTILLQVAPPRGQSGGRVESFLRIMREIERHPQILHLPPPHMWQITPSSSSVSSTIVVTLEIHVSRDLGDKAVLELTRWVWDRCCRALSGGVPGGAEVTVGVVRE